MPHQCLKCGSVFADGSPEILRGCPECGGTRFFYTEKPLPDDERNQLKDQANKDIKHLIREMLTGDSQIDIKESFLESDEWVNLGPKTETEPEKAEVDRKLDVKSDMLKSVEELVYPKDSKFRKYRVVPKASDKKEPEKVVKKAGVKESGKAKVKASPKAAQPKERKKEERVEVISIDSEGVYDIDVEKLLEDSPIIVQKDGSYMVHLPSVFKKAGKKESTF